MKIRKCRKKYAVIIDRRTFNVYLTRDKSEFYYSSVNRIPTLTCNFNRAKEHIKRCIDKGFVFLVVK
jgi:hypothetical protein